MVLDYLLSGLRVVYPDMIRHITYKEIVFGKFKDHVYGLVLENNLLQRHNVLVVDLTIELESW
jgi:hypothetical protein